MGEVTPVAASVGSIPSGLFIVCAKDPKGEGIDGFLGSWIQQVSFDPLLVSLAVKSGRPAADYILKGEVFTINVVGEHDKSFLKHFWSGYQEDVNPFKELSYRIEQGGVVLESAKSAMICQLKETSLPGDHNLVVAKVIDGVVNEQKAKSSVHLRKSGLDY